MEGTPFTTLHPRLFHIMSFFGDPGLVKRDYFHCCQTQPVPREYNTQYYVVEVQTLVELNPNTLVRHFQRMGQSVRKPRVYNGEWSPQGGSREYSMESLGRILKVPQGLLRGISRGQSPREIPRSSSAARGFTTDFNSCLCTGPVHVHAAGACGAAATAYAPERGNGALANGGP